MKHSFGRYPTPVFRASALDGEHGELWVKNDGVVNPRYGGNKIRKLEYLVAEAERRKARRIVTVGALGSHHVLATTVFARERGLDVAAVLCPQPWTEHAGQTLAAGLALGLEVRTAPSMASVPLVVPRLLRPGDYFVPAGGSNTLGTLGYVDAAEELSQQIATGELPEPDVIVAALGSGGTVAGLVAGAARYLQGPRVLGVEVAVPRVLSEPLVLALAWSAARREKLGVTTAALARVLAIDGRHLGRGYGWPTADGAAATRAAQRAGLVLDPTYTAKTFAKCLELVGFPGFRGARPPGARGRQLRVLYWHTLSAAPPERLLGTAPSALPERLRRHFLPSRGH